jgi:peroxiredoxin
VKVFGISTALGQHNRPPDQAHPRTKPSQPRRAFPFPLLTDFPPACRVHKQWGRYDENKKKPLKGAFLIHRAGWVTCHDGVPRPLSDPDAAIDDLLK